MAANLTEQVRGIVKVVTAVANGDLKQNLTVKSKGEVAALAETINNMTDTLATFADQVTTVAREVGVEGRLGGQANVPGAAGTWKDLTGNVNLLAANLTTQVRAIAEVATAVTKGDLTRSIQVEARGEVAELKDNINTMIGNLRLTTERNTEQDWLKTNLARFTNMLQGQRDLVDRRPACCCPSWRRWSTRHNGVDLPGRHRDRDRACGCCRPMPTTASTRHPTVLDWARAWSARCALDARPLLITDVPANVDPDPLRPATRCADAISIVLPVLFEGQVKAVIELASVVAIHRPADDVPRAADRRHRHRAQQHRSDDADRGPAQAVAAARDRIADAAEGAAADQRAARAEGAAARRAAMSRSSARTRKSNRRAARWRRRRPSSR